MQTVDNICKQFTTKLDSIVKKQRSAANSLDKTATALEKDASVCRAEAKAHHIEAGRATKAIEKIKGIFGAI